MTSDLLKALIERAKNLLLKPAETWDAIAAEEADVPTLYKTWIMPLAAIGPIAGFIGLTVIGTSALGFTYRMPIANGLSFAVVSYALTLAGVYAMAYIIDALAPHFGAEKNFKQAFKLAAYFPVAGWLAGVFALLPPISILSIVGLYSFYLLYIGLPKLMKPPADKAGGFTLSAIGAVIVLYIVIAFAASAMFAGVAERLADNRDSRPVASRDSGSRVSDSRTTPSASTAGKAPASTPEEALGAALGAVLGGGAASGPVVQSDALLDLVPNRLLGLRQRSENVSENDGPFPGVELTAEYGEPGERSLTLTIVNSPMLPSMMGMLGLAAAANEETDDGYRRVTRDDEDFIVEEWDESSEIGRYGRTIGGTFMIDASGNGLSMRDLERAVSEFSLRDLQRLPTTEE